MRSSWILFATLFFLDLELLLLAVGYMLNNNSILLAANSIGFVVAFCSCKSTIRTSHLYGTDTLQIGRDVPGSGRVA